MGPAVGFAAGLLRCCLPADSACRGAARSPRPCWTDLPGLCHESGSLPPGGRAGGSSCEVESHVAFYSDTEFGSQACAEAMLVMAEWSGLPLAGFTIFLMLKPWQPSFVRQFSVASVQRSRSHR